MSTHCNTCGHEHRGAALAYVCIGCPSPERPGEPKPSDIERLAKSMLSDQYTALIPPPWQSVETLWSSLTEKQRADWTRRAQEHIDSCARPKPAEPEQTKLCTSQVGDCMCPECSRAEGARDELAEVTKFLRHHDADQVLGITPPSLSDLIGALEREEHRR